MSDKLLLDLLKNKKYFNIVAQIMACRAPFNQNPLKEWLGERGAFDAIKRVMGFTGFARQTDLSKNPIALTPCGHIYTDHFQVAGAYLANKYSIGTITKKIPCHFDVYDEAWARQVFIKTFEELDKFYDKTLEYLAEQENK